MGRGYSPILVLYTSVSVCAFAWRMKYSITTYQGDTGSAAVASGVLWPLFQSPITGILGANVLLSLTVSLALCTKELFFGQLSLMEMQKLIERLINLVIFKGLFLALIAQPEKMQIAFWMVWFSVLGFLKLFQGLAKDRLERLYASPAATLLSHMRVFAVLVLVFMSDMFWMHICLFMFKKSGVSTVLLLLFEPLSIAFDSLQAMLVHGVHLFDTWNQNINDTTSQCSEREASERSVAGAAWEWRRRMVQNCSFCMDIISLLLALGHCLHIWWLRGLAFQVVDGILFLNVRAVLSAVLRRIKGFMRVKTAMSTLQGALPDATNEDLLAYEDDCAICKEPMGRAKRLPCSHLFHLSCLLSWLDQGIADTYSCPTCRRPLFMGSAKMNASSSRAGHEFMGRSQAGTNALGMAYPGGNRNEMFGAALSQGVTNPLTGPFLHRQWNGSVNSSWRVPEDSSRWMNAFDAGTSNVAGVGSSTARSLVNMQTVFEHLSHSHQSVGEANWSWWPFQSRVGESTAIPIETMRESGFDTGSTQSQILMPSDGRNGRDIHMQTMIHMVREVLPDIPEFVIFQDLQRTNNVNATVNNLL